MDLKCQQNLNYDWYQTDKYVTVSAFAKNVPKEQVNVAIGTRTLAIALYKETEKELSRSFNLFGSIIPVKSSWKCLSTKVEVMLWKETQGYWESLEAATPGTVTTSKYIMAKVDTTTEKPTASGKSVNKWDKLAAQVTKQEKTEIEKEGSLPYLLQMLFAGGDDDQKKAMQKSFLESNGTVLSMNWEEVGQGPVKMRSPDGMEYKKYEK